LQVFFQGVLGTRFGSLEFQIRSLESENYHRVPKIRKNRVRRIREIGSLHIQTGFLTFSLKKLVFGIMMPAVDCDIVVIKKIRKKQSLAKVPSTCLKQILFL